MPFVSARSNWAPGGVGLYLLFPPRALSFSPPSNSSTEFQAGGVELIAWLVVSMRLVVLRLLFAPTGGLSVPDLG
jgi:hypothetical protein